jgi:hypothetical protein
MTVVAPSTLLCSEKPDLRPVDGERAEAVGLRLYAARAALDERPVAQALASEAVDPRLIRLKAAEPFDPLVIVPDFTGAIPDGPALAPAGGRYRLVQLHGPVSASKRSDLSDRGARILGYIPNNSLLVRLPEGVSDAVMKASPHVRYVGPFLAGYNLSPGLFHSLRELGEEPDPVRLLRLDVLLFADQSPSELAADITEKYPGVLTESTRPGRRGEPPTLTLLVPEVVLGSLVGSLLHRPVAYVGERVSPRLSNDNSVWIGQSYDRDDGPQEATAPDPKPYDQTATIWNQGLLGTGQVVAIADTDLETGLCFWEDTAHAVIPQQVPPPTALTVDPAHRKVLAVNGAHPLALQTKGSFGHGTHVSGTVAGDDSANPRGTGSAGHDHGDGMAPGAKIIFEDISTGSDNNCIGTLFVASVGDLLEQEYVSGAHISTNSWGEELDEYSVQTREVDVSVWQHEDFLVLFAAGNHAASGIDDQARCKNCIAVGACQEYEPDSPLGPLDPENIAAFSSHGPAADGRVKPDLVAPGDRVFSGRFRTQYIEDEADPRCDPEANPTVDVCFPNPAIGGCYLTFTAETCSVSPHRGTSMATPTVAGLAALTREYFTAGFYPTGRPGPGDAMTPSAALLKAVLINGARNMTGTLSGNPLSDAPSNQQGWGRLLIDDALVIAGDIRRLKLLDVANPSGLTTGQTASTSFSVTSTGEPLKLALVWTDPPAAVAALPALVNDLDLELEAPDGTLYRGNQWTADNPAVPGDKESLPDPAGRDAINNVEGIFIPSPQQGGYLATVRAVNVPGYQGLLTQGYALVMTGAIDTAPAGSVPDGAGVPGAPLTLDEALGNDITLTWDPSCLAGDADYEIYEGTLGDFASHTPVACSTGGATTETITPSAGNRYYLVVPVGADREGSHGTDSTGSQRQRGPAPCLEQEIAACH